MSQRALDRIAENRLTQSPELNLSNCEVDDSILEQLSTHNWSSNLDLSSNQISTLTDLAGLTSLQELYLRANRISTLTGLAGLTSLQKLDLYSNQISTLTDLAGLTSLQELYLRANQISDLNQLQQLIALPVLSSVNFSNNPLSLPSELADDLAGLRSYFTDLHKGEAKRQQVKLLFLGDGCAGKSTLYQHLRVGHQPTPIGVDERTHGIALDTWDDTLPGIDVQVWDFGGQDIFHSTHRLFLGQRAVYVLVWTKQENKKCTAGEQHPLRYWLEFIADYGQDSTVLLVENTIDGQFDSAEFPDDTSLEKLIQEYRQKQITLVPTHNRIDCLHGTDDVLDFTATLQRRIKTLAQQQPTGDMAANWYAVQRALTTLRQTQRTLSLTEYDALCQEHDIADSRAFLRYLHNTGVVSHYEGLFNDQLILQTGWILDAMYALLKLDSNPLARQQGKLTDADFASVWQANYTSPEQELFKSYMLKSELIVKPFNKYATKQQRAYQYLVPALFPVGRLHDKIQWSLHPRYLVIKFRFMYRAIMQRLQVRVLTYCHVSEEESLYQNRISFTDQTGHTAHIEVLEDEKEMRILAENEALYADILAELNRIYPLDRVTLLERTQGQADKTLSFASFSHRLNEASPPGFTTPSPTPNTMKEPISIFVTYAWNNANGTFDADHQAQVHAFVDALHDHGDFHVTFDLYENEKETATDFNKMMLHNMSSADKVIAILSEGYAKTADVFERSIGGVEYPAILSHIRQQPQKFCLVSFNKLSDLIYPYGLAARDTVTILNGELKASVNAAEKNRLFIKLKGQDI